MERVAYARGACETRSMRNDNRPAPTMVLSPLWCKVAGGQKAEAEVMGMNNVFLALDEACALTLHSPLESLFAQYKVDRDGIERIAGYVEDAKQMHYFFEAASVDGRGSHASAADVFQLDPALRALDATYWQRAMLLTDVLEYMPADKRNEWHEQISKHKTPAFEKDSVKGTLIQMLNNRATFMAQRVDGLFRALSGSHVTNMPQAFGKRFILDYMLSYGRISYQRANYIHDLRCVIGKFLGREVGNSHSTNSDLDNMARDGQWNEFDGGTFKIRLYKKGTAHMEVHPDLAWQLNKVLAFLYPMAIPAEFRTKPVRKPKEHKLHHDLISFEVLKDLDRGLPYHSKAAMNLSYEHKEPPLAPTIAIMERLGGCETSKGFWEFGYLIEPVLKELSRFGRIPEQKSHQFYPTPTELAEIAVAMAEIEPYHTCLEPSAGQGGLADLMPKSTTCVEVSALHCAVLKAKGYRVIHDDFLKVEVFDDPTGKTPWIDFDRIVMNPPFSDGRAVDHVRYAGKMLSDNGILVAIMPASNKGKIIVEGMKHEWSKVYDNEFKDASVNVVMLKLFA